MNLIKLGGVLLVVMVLCHAPAVFAQAMTPPPTDVTNANSSMNSTSSKSSEIRGDSTPVPGAANRDSDTGPEADAPQTVYSKTGLTDHKEDNVFGAAPSRGKINYGKGKKEQVVATDSSKPAAIRKNQFGADVSASTGVFKSSLLDQALDLRPLPSASPQPKPSVISRVDRQSDKNKPAVEPLAAPQFEIGLGVAPEPSLPEKGTRQAAAAEPTPAATP